MHRQPRSGPSSPRNKGGNKQQFGSNNNNKSNTTFGTGLLGNNNEISSFNDSMIHSLSSSMVGRHHLLDSHRSLGGGSSSPHNRSFRKSIVRKNSEQKVRRHNPAVTASTPNRFPECPSADVKLRLIFDEMDMNNNRLIVCDGFERLIRVLHIEFSKETIQSLFGVAVVDKCKKSAIMNYSQYLDWAAKYPTLIDALYERSRAAVERVKREAVIAVKKCALENVQDQEKKAYEKLEEIQGELEGIQGHQADRARSGAQRVQAKAHTEEYAGYQQEIEFLKIELSEQEDQLAEVREEEREALIAIQETQSSLGKHDKKLDTLSKTIKESEDKEQALEQLLMEASRRTASLTESIDETTIQRMQLEDEEELCVDRHREAVEARTNAQEDVNAVQGESDELQTHCDDIVKDRKSNLVDDQQIRNQTDRKQRHELRKAEYQFRLDSEKRLSELDTLLRDIEREEVSLQEYRETRQSYEEAQQPLLDHEVMLREQRENVDLRDDQLFLASAAFRCTTDRGTRSLNSSFR